MKSKELIINIVIFGLCLVFFVLGYFLLPNELVVQMNSLGTPSNVLPKIPALLIPCAITILFEIFFYKTKNPRYLFGALIGILCFILLFVFNM